MKHPYFNLILTLVFTGLYFVASKLNATTGYGLPLELLSLFLLLVFVPLRVLSLFRLRLPNSGEKILALATLYFFLFVPLIYAGSVLFDLPLGPTNIGGLALIIGLLSLLFPDSKLETNKPLQWKVVIRTHWPLWGTFLLYVILHFINYRFYHFIPEWDSYSKLLEINKVVQSGSLLSSYRGFFTASQATLASFGSIDPYRLFSFWMILLQFLSTLVLYLLARTYKLKPSWQFLTLLGTLAIPVLTMEIDTVRPQSIALMYFPIYTFFFYRALTSRKNVYWILSTLIALCGLNYHEFFLILLAIHLVWAGYYGFQKYFLSAKSRGEKTLFKLVILLAVCLLLSIVSRVSSLGFAIRFIKLILVQVSDIANWKLWFLNNYNTDGAALSIGWPGWQGALKYYAYYASPYIFLIAALRLGLVIRKKNFSLLHDQLWQILFPGLVILISLAEVLPRLNFIYLPERTWVFIDSLVLVGSIPLYGYLQGYLKPQKEKVLYSLILGTILIGIGGSVYIAQSKKALTSPAEYQSALWIRDNTPANALFITQPSNGPLVRYFAGRTLDVPLSSSFFLSSDLEEVSLPLMGAAEQASLNAEWLKTVDEYQKVQNSQYQSVSTFLEALASIQQKAQLLQEKLLTEAYKVSAPTYILYSEHKLSGLYAQRDWWLTSNYAGANLDKFNRAYPVLYNKDGIHIWHIPNP